MTDQEFIEYCFEFYGEGGLYPINATHEMIEACLNLLKANQDHEYAADSFDRELVRDLMIEKYQLEWKN